MHGGTHPGGDPGPLGDFGTHWSLSSTPRAPWHVLSGVLGPSSGNEKPQSAAELDIVLQRQQHLQEKLAEEMLGLARSLKTNTLAAQNVIKMDNQV